MNEPNINVGIMAEKEIEFTLNGDYNCKKCGKIFNGNYSVKLNDGKVTLKDGQTESDFDFPLEFSPVNHNDASFVLKGVTIGINFHWERKEDQVFPGSLRLIEETGKIRAVNVLPLEDYLLSVISSEMSASSSVNLLKAHAVISRSWLIAQIEKSKQLKQKDESYVSTIESDEELIKWYDREDHIDFDVCSDDHCQRYQGIAKATTEKVRNAIAETRGEVLMYDNKICDARFSKSCGGISETFENAWEPIHYPYLSKVIDNDKAPEGYNLDLTKEEAADKWIRTSPPAFCNTTDKNVLSQVLMDYDQETEDFYRWTVEYTQDEISALIKERSGIDFGKIIDLIPIERGESARLIKMKIVGTKKTLTIGKELEIRRTLSKSHLYSSAIVFDKVNVNDNIPAKFIITGAGWGHGVGLCQIGAAVMGDKGYDYDAILKHYFRGAGLVTYYK